MDSTDAPQIIEHIHKSLNFTPYDTRWVPFSARWAEMIIFFFLFSFFQLAMII